MRKELFNAVKAKLASDVPEVAHVDMWNQNVEFIEQEDGWERPAVFVEFGPITWDPVKLSGHRGKGTVNVHLVTDWADGEYDLAFDLCEKIREAIEGLYGERFGCLTLCQTATSHNHEELLESIDTYAVRYQTGV